MFNNHRLFLKHTGKYHIVKAESREVSKINLKYQSTELRARLPIGEKFSISAGAIYRTHDRAYGYNPVEIWLNEIEVYTNSQGDEYEYPRHVYLGFWAKAVGTSRVTIPHPIYAPAKDIRDFPVAAQRTSWYCREYCKFRLHFQFWK